MGNIFKKIEESMTAAAFAEAGEQEYARTILAGGKSASKKVLLGTDCPEITTKILDHALNLCRRLGASLEVFQIISPASVQASATELVEAGMKRLGALQQRLRGVGIAYEYAIKETLLEDELIPLAQKRRDILAVVIPLCGLQEKDKPEFQSMMSQRFKCPVVFFEA